MYVNYGITVSNCTHVKKRSLSLSCLHKHTHTHTHTPTHTHTHTRCCSLTMLHTGLKKVCNNFHEIISRKTMKQIFTVIRIKTKECNKHYNIMYSLIKTARKKSWAIAASTTCTLANFIRQDLKKYPHAYMYTHAYTYTNWPCSRLVWKSVYWLQI